MQLSLHGNLAFSHEWVDHSIHTVIVYDVREWDELFHEFLDSRTSRVEVYQTLLELSLKFHQTCHLVSVRHHFFHCHSFFFQELGEYFLESDRFHIHIIRIPLGVYVLQELYGIVDILLLSFQRVASQYVPSTVHVSGDNDSEVIAHRSFRDSRVSSYDDLIEVVASSVSDVVTLDNRISARVWDKEHILIKRYFPEEGTLIRYVLIGVSLSPRYLSVFDYRLAEDTPFRVISIVLLEPYHDSIVLDDVS